MHNSGGIRRRWPVIRNAYGSRDIPISVHVIDAVGQVSTSENFDIQILAQGFAPTASMGTARIFHTARESLLNNGKVLVAGGANSDGKLPAAKCSM